MGKSTAELIGALILFLITAFLWMYPDRFPWQVVAINKELAATVRVTSITKHKHPPKSKDADVRIQLDIEWENLSKKEIIGIKGRLIIFDIFGEELAKFRIEMERPIPPGERDYDFFAFDVQEKEEPNYYEFANLPSDRYSFKWKTDMIVFKDGTNLGLQRR